jgi:hypothetical protein
LSVLPQFYDFLSKVAPVTPEVSDFGRDVPQMVDTAAFVVPWDKFRIPESNCKDAALPTIYAVDTKMEHPLKPFDILKDEDLENKENYGNIDPIHYKICLLFQTSFWMHGITNHRGNVKMALCN